MNKVTLIIDFDDSNVPSFHARQDICGGKLSFVAFSDLNESNRKTIERIIKNNLGRLPSTNDDAYDQDYRDAAVDILADIANEFDLLDEKEVIDDD